MYPPGGAFPSGGGYPSAPGAYASQGVLADWGVRALGYLIDAAVVLVVLVPLYILGAVVSVGFTYLGWLVGLAIGIFLAVQVGQVGQSPGMRTVGIKCVHQQTGQTIGAGLAIVRAIAHVVDTLICYVGWLFPLWDRNRQTLADKIMSTVVVRVPPQSFSLTPPP